MEEFTNLHIVFCSSFISLLDTLKNIFDDEEFEKVINDIEKVAYGIRSLKILRPFFDLNGKKCRSVKSVS